MSEKKKGNGRAVQINKKKFEARFFFTSKKSCVENTTTAYLTRYNQFIMWMSLVLLANSSSPIVQLRFLWHFLAAQQMVQSKKKSEITVAEKKFLAYDISFCNYDGPFWSYDGNILRQRREFWRRSSSILSGRQEFVSCSRNCCRDNRFDFDAVTGTLCRAFANLPLFLATTKVLSSEVATKRFPSRQSYRS